MAYLSRETIERITSLRKQGWSLNEIKTVVKAGKTTIFNYIKNVEVLPQYKKTWLGKRGGSRKRRDNAIKKATDQAKTLISNLSIKEKTIFLTALYWGEGSKSDFGLSNTDSELIKVFVKGLKEIFNISRDRLKVSVRIYEDLDKNKCLRFWSQITGVPVNKFVSVNILKGKKQGKLSYGMCRIRVQKGGDILKYVNALKKEIIDRF